jgi:hypothetical protein
MGDPTVGVQAHGIWQRALRVTDLEGGEDGGNSLVLNNKPQLIYRSEQ